MKPCLPARIAMRLAGRKLGIIILLLVIGYLGAGCGTVSTTGGSGTLTAAALQGTWRIDYSAADGGGWATYSFDASDYAYRSSVGNYDSTGTYAISGSTIIFNTTSGYSIGTRAAQVIGTVLKIYSGADTSGFSTDYTKQ